MRGIRSAVAGLVATVVLVSVVVAVPAGATASRDGLACGGLVAYSEQNAGPNSSRLMAVPAFGGTPRVIWDRPDAVQGELDPAWSPDGRAIAFAGRLVNASGVVADNRLYVLRTGATEPEIVVDQVGQRGGLRTPTWSPDGTRIAYATGVPPVGQPFQGLAWVRIVDVTTGEDSFLTGFTDPLGTTNPMGVLDVAWSPLGDQLLVTTVNQVTNHWTIFSVRPAPGDPSPTVAISEDTGARATTGYPAFVPSGRSVLVEQDEPDHLSSRLYLTDPGLRHLLPITPVAGWESQPDFGRLPLQAVYAKYNGGDASIAVLRLPTGTSRTLVPPTAGVFVEQPDWQPVIGCRHWPFSS